MSPAKVFGKLLSFRELLEHFVALVRSLVIPSFFDI